jgi:hypothetical protein
MKGILAASLVLLVLSCPASAQAPAGPEARLKALNITLPPDAAPAANFVNSVQTGKLLFLSGNTAGPAWVGKGKLGKDLTVEQGRDSHSPLTLKSAARVDSFSLSSRTLVIYKSCTTRFLHQVHQVRMCLPIWHI